MCVVSHVATQLQCKTNNDGTHRRLCDYKKEGDKKEEAPKEEAPKEETPKEDEKKEDEKKADWAEWDEDVRACAFYQFMLASLYRCWWPFAISWERCQQYSGAWTVFTLYHASF